MPAPGLEHFRYVFGSAAPPQVGISGDDRSYALAVRSKYAMNDVAEQDRFLSDMARMTYQYFTTLADSNAYGQGLRRST